MAQRTDAQNKALHKYLELVATELAREGHTMQSVVKCIKRAEITPTKEALKEIVWRPIQEILFGKKSTTQLSRSEVSQVYEVMNKWLGENFELHIPWPAIDHGDTLNSEDRAETI